MKLINKELYVGVFVLIGLLCAGYLTVVLGGVPMFGSKGYTLYGYFTSVSGLKDGARIEMAGVEIGNVSEIRLDKERLEAKVAFRINQELQLSEDSIASIKTAGIIGEKYISISPGGSDIMLEDKEEFNNTESTLDIESLIRKFIFKDDN
ncbi:MAG TPA: outer membrane lipid asymmetry maintenance protein MlaD [Desulfobacter sp.]|uniref:outer membrane lipid asymmetry maintenance protein MlaD n=1 Tax=Desulfobacter sp. UBA2225 TaxID=1961413 RepID=UPI000E988642|nr:outer membrane lipid asymmetry maintenance protein MlaD [Desulfobacter sp. UBA2225]HAR34263.1 outer membrane lipid asymmetry maintenance protein MlaD [Desulfobacter sp.]